MERKQAPGTIRIDGRAIRRWREARLLSQRELAKRAGLRAETVNMLETGKRAHAYPKTVRALCEALGIEPAELLEIPHE